MEQTWTLTNTQVIPDRSEITLLGTAAAKAQGHSPGGLLRLFLAQVFHSFMEMMCSQTLCHALEEMFAWQCLWQGRCFAGEDTSLYQVHQMDISHVFHQRAPPQAKGADLWEPGEPALTSLTVAPSR